MQKFIFIFSLLHNFHFYFISWAFRRFKKILSSPEKLNEVWIWRERAEYLRPDHDLAPEHRSQSLCPRRWRQPPRHQDRSRASSASSSSSSTAPGSGTCSPRCQPSPSLWSSSPSSPSASSDLCQTLELASCAIPAQASLCFILTREMPLPGDLISDLTNDACRFVKSHALVA